MANALYINVAKPCHENWDKMAPVEQGRFCQSCNKQVIDFTTLSDDEIIGLLTKKNTGTCGRFTQSQLNTPIQAPPSKKLSPKLSVFLAAFVSVFLLLNEATAQENIIMGKVAAREQRAVPVVTGDSVFSAAPKTVVSGSVKDAAGTAIIGATVVLKGTKTITTTDSGGHFLLQLPPNSNNVLAVSFVGYFAQELVVPTDSTKPINIQLDMNTMLLGEVLVVSRKPKRQKR